MWQEALGLDEWSIDVELIEARQMPEQAAACAFTAARREAKIRLAKDIESDEELHNCIAHQRRTAGRFVSRPSPMSAHCLTLAR